MTSDDDDGPNALFSGGQNGFDAWSSDSSLHSVESFSNTRFPHPGFPQHGTSRKMTSAGKQAASQSEHQRISAPKLKLPRQTYVGPTLSDPDEPLSDEADFERFKMMVRMQKIVEFHQMAAQADIELAIAVYKDRKAQSAEGHEVSTRVTEHQKRMMQLQMEKEEERKNIVKTERSKRRSELRRRPGRSGTLIAPIPSVPTPPFWLNSLQEQVIGDLESNLSLQKILSVDPDNREENIDMFVQQMFPGSNFSDASPLSVNETNQPSQRTSQVQFSSTAQLGFGVPSTSTAVASTSATAGSELNGTHMPRRRLSNAQTPRHTISRTKPSLFGDEDSSDEEDRTPLPPPVTSAQPSNPFINGDASAFLSNELMADAGIASAFAQWGVMKDVHSPSTPSWTGRQAMQTPTVENPNPWGAKDVRSTPFGTTNKRKASFPVAQPSPLQTSFSPFDVPEQSELPMGLTAMAAFNSAHAKEKRSVVPSMNEHKPVVEGSFRLSPRNSSPPSAPVGSVAHPMVASSVQQVKIENPSTSTPSFVKRPNKKRQALKKVGTASTPDTEDQEETTPALSEPASKNVNLGYPSQAGTYHINLHLLLLSNTNLEVVRARKDSAHAWGDVMSTPRPTSKIPFHLQGGNGAKAESDSPLDLGMASGALHEVSGMSTIKAQQWSAPSRGVATRSAWSIFPSVDSGPSKPQTATPIHPIDREQWLPGSFDINGDVARGSDSEESPPTAQFSTRPTLAPDKLSVPHPQQQSRLVRNKILRENDVTSSSPPIPKTIPITTQAPSPITTKKGKNKKGKGKQVRVEEVPDDEPENRGGCLPVDSPYILEPKTILEPKPSVPPTMFESIISYGDDDEGDSTSSSIATPSTAPSSPPDLFDGDEARIAAAIKELQEGTAHCAQMEHKLWRPALNSKNTTGARRFSVNKPETATPFSTQFRANNKDSNATNTSGNDAIPKPAVNPAIQNLKRSKATTGGKLF